MKTCKTLYGGLNDQLLNFLPINIYIYVNQIYSFDSHVYMLAMNIIIWLQTGYETISIKYKKCTVT